MAETLARRLLPGEPLANLVIVDNPNSWDLELPGAEVVAARDYLTEPRYSGLRRAKVFNLCRSYAYQSTGYYVSLLATARGHKPMPSVTTLRDLRVEPIVRSASEELESLVQHSMATIKSDRFTLSIYFGRNLAKRYDRLAKALFNFFPAPLLRAELVLAGGRRKSQWRIESLRVIAGSDVPESHRPFLAARAARYFARPVRPATAEYRYELAILIDPAEVDAPSNEKAIERFVKAGRQLGINAGVIERDDYGRLAEYDALFIRQTTAVNHHTYRFAARAEAEGMVVIDDPESIVRCTNKVYQAEVFARHAIPSPKTMIVHRGNAAELAAALGLPCVLKRPDSSFSQGVRKAATPEELAGLVDEFFARSELIVAQEFVPSEFDWRIGVIDRRPLFACRYFMARGHWQIQRGEGNERRSYGKVETLPIDSAPMEVVQLAVQAASVIGDGFYGVDIKETAGRFMVMEVNDNPNVEAGVEDKVLGNELYRSIMRVFRDRLDLRGIVVAS